MSTTGRDYLIELSDDGGTTWAELECQGDATINTGISVSRTVAKNCVHTHHQDDGFSVTGSFLEERPLGAAPSVLWTAHEGRAELDVRVQDRVTGGMSFTGKMKAAVTEIGAPVNGAATHSFTLSQSGTITRGTVA